jgi:hypothetical protein
MAFTTTITHPFKTQVLNEMCQLPPLQKFLWGHLPGVVMQKLVRQRMEFVKPGAHRRSEEENTSLSLEH